MEAQFSEDFKKLFLLSFTKEIIKQFFDPNLVKLQAMVEERERDQPTRQQFVSVQEKTQVPVKISPPIYVTSENFSPIPSIMSTTPERNPLRPEMRRIPGRVNIQRRQTLRPGVKSSLYIPEPSLPSHLDYLKPIATNVEMDLQKLSILIKDPAVKIIECNPEEKVKVSGNMGTKTTGIIMTKEDIDGIVDKFAITSKIPAEEGIYRVVVGNLILSAIISEVIGSRFILKKIMPASNRQYLPAQRGLPRRTILKEETIIKHI